MKMGQKRGTHLPLEGVVYGKLTAINVNGRNYRKRYLWLCKCECGKTKLVPQDLLTSGKTKSCGCLLSESRVVANKYPDREHALLRIQYLGLIKRHKKLSSDDTITFDQFKILSYLPCKYCGEAPTRHIYDSRSGIRVSDFILKINGIDRMNSDIGYTHGNSVSCCQHCNSAKMCLSTEQFMSLILKIYHNWANNK